MIKHAAATTAHVTISYGADSLAVEITDEGLAAPPGTAASATSSPGHGIIGMRERVAVFGGEFAAESRPGGGFRVRACFPTTRVTR